MYSVSNKLYSDISVGQQGSDGWVVARVDYSSTFVTTHFW